MRIFNEGHLIFRSHLPLLFIGMQHIQLANPVLANDYLSAAAEISPCDPLVMHERGVVAYYQEQFSLFSPASVFRRKKDVICC
jgi:hypothetical protein